MSKPRQHRFFRPSDFAWGELPQRLAGIPAAPLIYVLQAADLWPEVDSSSERPRRALQWRVAFTIALTLCLLFAYPLSGGLAAYLDGAGITSGELIPLYAPLIWNADRPTLKPWMAYVGWCERMGRNAKSE